MRILNDLIADLKFDAPVTDIRVGFYHTAVLTRYCGLAASLPKDVLKQEGHQIEAAGLLLDKNVRELAQLAFSARLLEAAIGLATINSLLDVDLEKCFEINAAEIILEMGTGKEVAIIGHFPFVDTVRKHARRLTVIEKNPQPGDRGADEAARVLPNADVVAITGTSLTNHTFEQLIGLCSSRAYVVVLGDTVPLSPVLFDHRVDAICGTRVVDPALALRCISQGATFRQIKGTRRLTLQR
jgi:uncharacterized protein